jgi:hypothetical protein
MKRPARVCRSLEQLAGRLEEAAAVQGRGGGSGISAGFTFAHGCTLWVGGLPVEYASSGTVGRTAALMMRRARHVPATAPQ